MAEGRNCGCGRSPTGQCIGWHTPSSLMRPFHPYYAAKEAYEVKQAAKAQAARNNLVTITVKYGACNCGEQATAPTQPRFCELASRGRRSSCHKSIVARSYQHNMIKFFRAANYRAVSDTKRRVDKAVTAMRAAHPPTDRCWITSELA